MLLNPNQLDLAVQLQAKSYLFLKWISQSVASGQISFQTAHHCATLPEAARNWIDSHYQNIPAASRVERSLIPAFANFFSTYLTNTFDLASSSRQIKFSPQAHCFCPMCSWMIEAPRLRTKSLTATDKKRAIKMQCKASMQLALDVGIGLATFNAETFVREHDIATAQLAYGHDLLERMDGFSNGPAVLALWRRIAWSESGSPKAEFKLTSSMILAAEAELMSILQSRQF